MQRVQHQRQTEAIAYALSFFPPEWVEVYEDCVDFFCGTDAVFAGMLPEHCVSRYDDGTHRPCCAYPWTILGSHRDPVTIVLPWDRCFDTEVIIHELGHVMHMINDFEVVKLTEVSTYARESGPHEVWADGFMAYHVMQSSPRYRSWYLDTPLDRQSYNYFDSLV